MKEITKVSELTGDVIIELVKAHKDVAWLKKIAKDNHSFIALRSAVINRYDELKQFRKTAKKPLWEQISELEE